MKIREYNLTRSVRDLSDREMIGRVFESMVDDIVEEHQDRWDNTSLSHRDIFRRVSIKKWFGTISQASYKIVDVGVDKDESIVAKIEEGLIVVEFKIEWTEADPLFLGDGYRFLGGVW